MNANQEQRSIKKVSSEYTPYLALALCWKDQGQTGFFYDKVPVSFARHPCDLFDLNGNREEWKDLTGYTKDVCEDMLPEKAKYLWKNIAGGIQVSSFGRVGIPIKCNEKNELFKGCKGCALSERTVSIALEENKTESIDKCTKFHFILPQYEKCSWNEKEEEFNSDYNGYLVVNINGEERLVYELVAEAFELKKAAFQKMKEFMKKKEIEFDDENKLKDDFNNEKLQIHHINNNGHHNTPWNGEDGNLIALPESVHKEIHKIKNPS